MLISSVLHKFFYFCPQYFIIENEHMKKLTSILMLLCLLSFNSQFVSAQEEPTAEEATVEAVEAEAEDANMQEEVVEEGEEGEEAAATTAEEASEEDAPLQAIKQKFIEGGPLFMTLPLLCLVFGLAIAIERILSLFYMSINTNKFVADIDEAVAKGGLEEAKELCRNTRGPIASIFYQGLDRADKEDVVVVEKAVVNYGSVMMGQLEKGLVWLSLFIALAPMLGFLGTVIGMIDAFDAIKKAGDIAPGVVADGISVALLTTVAGLIVAIILQVFYNYIVTKVDNIVNKMEDASISLIDILVKNNVVKG